jgi:hypothetical protein
MCYSILIVVPFLSLSSLLLSSMSYATIRMAKCLYLDL